MTMTLATPMSERITIREAAKAARVPIGKLRDYLRGILSEDWLDADTRIEPVMAQTAAAIVKELIDNPAITLTLDGGAE